MHENFGAIRVGDRAEGTAKNALAQRPRGRKDYPGSSEGKPVSHAKDKVWPFRLRWKAGRETREKIIADQIAKAMKDNATTKTAMAARMRVD
jgi:hypothetical protein